MPALLRALLWIVLIVAPGGVLLLPLLVGDAALRRKKAARQSVAAPVDAAPAHSLVAPASTR